MTWPKEQMVPKDDPQTPYKPFITTRQTGRTASVIEAYCCIVRSNLDQFNSAPWTLLFHSIAPRLQVVASFFAQSTGFHEQPVRLAPKMNAQRIDCLLRCHAIVNHVNGRQ